MALIHITTKKAWTQILESGELRPGSMVVPKVPGRDPDKVSAFMVDDGDIEDCAFLARLKGFVAESKNALPWSNLAAEDLVVLRIYDRGNGDRWVCTPGEEREMRLGQLLADADVARIKGYATTGTPVPASCLSEVG